MIFKNIAIFIDDPDSPTLFSSTTENDSPINFSNFLKLLLFTTGMLGVVWFVTYLSSLSLPSDAPPEEADPETTMMPQTLLRVAREVGDVGLRSSLQIKGLNSLMSVPLAVGNIGNNILVAGGLSQAVNLLFGGTGYAMTPVVAKVLMDVTGGGSQLNQLQLRSNSTVIRTYSNRLSAVSVGEGLSFVFNYKEERMANGAIITNYVTAGAAFDSNLQLVASKQLMGSDVLTSSALLPFENNLFVAGVRLAKSFGSSYSTVPGIILTKYNSQFQSTWTRCLDVKNALGQTVNQVTGMAQFDSGDLLIAFEFEGETSVSLMRVSLAGAIVWVKSTEDSVASTNELYGLKTVGDDIHLLRGSPAQFSQDLSLSRVFRHSRVKPSGAMDLTRRFDFSGIRSGISPAFAGDQLVFSGVAAWDHSNYQHLERVWSYPLDASVTAHVLEHANAWHGSLTITEKNQALFGAARTIHEGLDIFIFDADTWDASCNLQTIGVNASLGPIVSIVPSLVLKSVSTGTVYLVPYTERSISDIVNVVSQLHHRTTECTNVDPNPDDGGLSDGGKAGLIIVGVLAVLGGFAGACKGSGGGGGCCGGGGGSSNRVAPLNTGGNSSEIGIDVGQATSAARQLKDAEKGMRNWERDHSGATNEQKRVSDYSRHAERAKKAKKDLIEAQKGTPV